MSLIVRLEVDVEYVAEGICTERNMCDPKVGSPVLTVGSILGIRPGFFLGLSRGGLSAESTDDGSLGVRISSAVEGHWKKRRKCGRKWQQRDEKMAFHWLSTSISIHHEISPSAFI